MREVNETVKKLFLSQIFASECDQLNEGVNQALKFHTLALLIYRYGNFDLVVAMAKIVQNILVNANENNIYSKPDFKEKVIALTFHKSLINYIDWLHFIYWKIRRTLALACFDNNQKTFLHKQSLIYPFRIL